jgi:EmrB/QacA subfamily drug resistance transporter
MWVILIVLLIADMMDLLDATLTNIAAPSVARDLGGGALLIKWLGSSYALAMGVLLVVGGRLGDKYGQRRIFLIGMAGFTLASALCGCGVSPSMIILARLAQGAFGALLIPQGMAIMTSTFSREMLVKAFSVFGPAMGVAAVGGPILGGFIINANVAGLSWRPMFLINIVLGTVGLFAATRLLPKSTGDGAVALDALGALCLAGTMLGTMYGLIDGSTNGWQPLPITSIVAGLVCFALFCMRQRLAPNPLILPSLLANRGFTAGLILGLAFFATVSGLSYVLSLYFQLGLGRSAGEAALDLAPSAVGIVIAATLGPKLIPLLGRLLVFAGLMLTIAGTGWFLATVVIAGMHASSWTSEPAILVAGLGMGFSFGTIFSAALSGIDQAEAGSASGALSAVQQLAACIGAAVITTVFFQTLHAGDYARAVGTSLCVAIGIAAASSALVWLLPARLQAEQGWPS